MYMLYLNVSRIRIPTGESGQWGVPTSLAIRVRIMDLITGRYQYNVHLLIPWESETLSVPK
jgi:hypothetical protein